MTTDTRKKISRWGLLVALSWIAICVFIAMDAFPFTGDDLQYLWSWNVTSEKYGILGYPAFVARHWLTTNGRMANALTPVLLSWLPSWLVDALLGLAYAALIVVILKSVEWGRGEHFAAKSLLTALVVFTLPWWDSLLLYDCWLNYPLAALLALASLYSMRICHSKLITFLLSVLAFVAGAMHEACGVALSAGIFVYWLLHRHTIGLSRKAIGVAFMAGAFLAASSPGIWTRLGSDSAGLRGPLETLALSDFYTLLLVAICSIAIFFNHGRRWLASFIHTRWTIFAVAAVVSSLFCAVSGIIGRTGFFAQIFALIALFSMFPYSRLKINPKLSATVGVVLLSITCAQMTLFGIWQRRLGGELQEVIAKYKDSPDGIVFADYTPDYDVPEFLLHKVRGVPDADDVWILYTIAWYYGDAGSRPLIILPQGLRKADLNAKTSPMRFGDTIITKTFPAGTYTIDTFEDIPLLATKIGDIEYIVTPFKLHGAEAFKLEPRYIDWGD